MPAKVISTTTQLSGLVEWWINDKGVQVSYEQNARGTGKIAPEYDHILWLQDRRIKDFALGSIITAELMELGHRYTTAQVLMALHRFIWANYIETHEYPEELRRINFAPKPFKLPGRKPGRPRKKPAAPAVPPEQAP